MGQVQLADDESPTERGTLTTAAEDAVAISSSAEGKQATVTVAACGADIAANSSEATPGEWVQMPEHSLDPCEGAGAPPFAQVTFVCSLFLVRPQTEHKFS